MANNQLTTVRDTQTLKIQKIIAGGLGLGRLEDGLVVMVPMVLTGETVKVRLVRRKKSYAEAELLEVMEASEERLEPPCPHFGQCGGCHLQHMSAACQTNIKQAILHEHLDRLNLPNLPLAPLFSAPSPFSYRQRVRLQVDDFGRLGFHQRGSHTVEPVSGCLLAEEPLNEILAQLTDTPKAAHLLENSEAVELLLSPKDSQTIILFHFKRKPRASDTKAASRLALLPGVKSIFLHTKAHGRFGPYFNHKTGSHPEVGKIDFALPEASLRPALQFSLEAGGFCQVNRSQNRILVDTLLEWADLHSNDRCLDLFCGMGNFSIPMAVRSKEVLGMDLQRSAIRSAKTNAEKNGLVNCIFKQQSAAEAARELSSRNESFDLVLLDPPRSGCAEVLPYLPELCANTLIYISCDPATLVRDTAKLLDLGFTLQKVAGLDMFPQTHHLESIVLFSRQ